MKMLCSKRKSVNDFFKLQATLHNFCKFHRFLDCGIYEIPSHLMKLEINSCTHKCLTRNLCSGNGLQDKSCVLRNTCVHRLRSKPEHAASFSVHHFSDLFSCQNSFMTLQTYDPDTLFNSRRERKKHSCGNVMNNAINQYYRSKIQLHARERLLRTFSKFSNPVALHCLPLSQTASIHCSNFPLSLRSGRKEKDTFLLICERLYSRDTGGNRESDKIDDIVDYLKDMHSQKDALKADPDLKAVLDDIKLDFHDNSSIEQMVSDSSSDSDPSSSDESASKDQNINSSNSTKAMLQEDDYIYDYRYADDIEDFGFDEDEEVEEERPEKIVPIPLTRGSEGVFDLDELLTFLDHLGLENVVTIEVPSEANYCDHMVVGSAKSKRHLQYINDEFLWIHKRKKSAKDPHLLIEGLDRSDWSAMDLGNIVLHVFYGDAREYYDIESLWTLGPELDPKCQELAHDPLALSEEQLFWLEASKVKEEETKKEVALKDKHQDKPSSVSLTNNWPDLSDIKLEQEAGWNDPKAKS